MLIGFMGLGIDVAAAYAKTQEVQNAADAGALAIAQSCAENPGDPLCSTGSSLAPDLADRNIRLGFDASAAPPEVSFPDPTSVNVRVTAESQSFFVALFGIDAFDVRADATAAWGSPTRMTTFLPLTIGECEFNALLLDSTTVVTVNLTKTSNVDCGTPASGNVMPGGFGYIGTGDCSTTVVDINVDDGWIKMDPGGEPPGCDPVIVRNIIDSREEVLVPIFDACRMRPNPQPDVNRCVLSTTEIPKDAYHIIGFAAIELHGVKFGGAGHELTYPSGMNTYCPGADRCIRGRFVRFVTLADAEEWGSTPDFGVTSVRLID